MSLPWKILVAAIVKQLMDLDYEKIYIRKSEAFRDNYIKSHFIEVKLLKFRTQSGFPYVLTATDLSLAQTLREY